ncbi:MAG: pyruvate formate lyase-activating protein [Oscillospiraceae bacterium]|nr:pyruvate formate lyase-activating protein [Oscillospiraceae bacterium]
MHQSQVTGQVHSIETFGLVDGPGVRSVIFLQGCPMRCQYCHNPETWSHHGGATWSAQVLFDRVYRFHNYWRNNGGITVSGGEPLLQIDFVTELFRLAKAKGVHTALDTSGILYTKKEPFYSKFQELMKVTDLVLLDLKEIVPERHKVLTGFRNEPILAMARKLSDLGIDMWIRHVLVPGHTDDPDGLREMDEFIQSLKTVRRVEILPYHTLGQPQWERMGVPYPLDGVPSPTKEEVQKAEELLHTDRYTNF